MSTVDEFLVHLMQDRGLSENTISAYRNDLSQFQKYISSTAVSGDGPSPTMRDPVQASGPDIMGFFLHLKEKGYAPATIARKMAAVKSLYHYLLKQSLVNSDPTNRIGAPPIRKSAPRALSPSEVEALLRRAVVKEKPEGKRDCAMLFLLYSTGMRVTELVSLNVGDIDLEAGTVRCVGRRGRSREIPIDEDALSALRGYFYLGRPSYSRNQDPEQPLFLNHRGQRLTRQGFWLIMKSLAHQAGLSGITPHTIRHTFAAHKLNSGLALRKLQELLGHANIATTQIYTQIRGARESELTTLAGA